MAKVIAWVLLGACIVLGAEVFYMGIVIENQRIELQYCIQNVQ